MCKIKSIIAYSKTRKLELRFLIGQFGLITRVLLLSWILIATSNQLTAQANITIEDVVYYSANTSSEEIESGPSLNIASLTVLVPDMEVYPNPFSTNLYVEIDAGGGSSGAYFIEILDNESNTVFESSITSLPVTFENVSFSQGTYYLTIRTRYGDASETIVYIGE